MVESGARRGGVAAVRAPRGSRVPRGPKTTTPPRRAPGRGGGGARGSHRAGISRAAGVVPAGGVPGRRRANWLEALASVLVAGAGPAGAPRSTRGAASLPVVRRGGRARRGSSHAEGARGGEVRGACSGWSPGAARRALASQRRRRLDASHPARGARDPFKGAARITGGWADGGARGVRGGPWAAPEGGRGWADKPGWSLSDCAESIAADVYGCLLDGRAPTGPAGRGGRPETTRNGRRSGLTSTASAKFGPASLRRSRVARVSGGRDGRPTGAALGAAAALGVRAPNFPALRSRTSPTFRRRSRAVARSERRGSVELVRSLVPERCSRPGVRGRLPPGARGTRGVAWGVDPSSERRGGGVSV